MIEIILSLVVVVGVGYCIAKKFNTTIALFAGGIVLLIAAALLNHTILDPKATSGNNYLDIFKTIENLFLKNLGNIGLTIMTLFGYSSYMTKIGANDKTVTLLTKPLLGFKYQYALIPFIFLLGNLMSLVIPSASSLGILLMATMFPILTRLNISPLAAGGVIATTATIMPTPLGADNVIAAETFNMSIVDYVIKHAKISIPALLIMAIVHYIWQRYLDKKEGFSNVELKLENENVKRINDAPTGYAILPLLPLILVLIINLGLPEIKFGLISITFVCFIFAGIIEFVRNKDINIWSKNIQSFFDGMGSGVANVVSLLVGATTLVEGLKALGIVDMITNSVKELNGAGAIMIISFSLVTLLIGFIAGGGLSVFYATVALLPSIAMAAGIEAYQIALPMQMVANLGRSISPVAAVIVIISSTMKVSPIKLIKRTSVPVLVGIIVCMILAFIV